MTAFLLIGAAVAASAPPPSPAPRALVAEAEHAIRVDRLDEAKLMIERAASAGAAGAQFDRAQADLAYASGKDAEALRRYETLLKLAPADPSLLEPAGIAALKLGSTERAFALLSRATAAPNASWRAWNALGAVADSRSDWRLADRCYATATSLAPTEVAPVNNQGWSLLLRGKWAEASANFEKASRMDPKSVRTVNNLELARAALAADLPERRPGEPASSWAARLNDAGVAAEVLGDQKRATAAFTRALDVSDTWYVRAADNLQALAHQ